MFESGISKTAELTISGVLDVVDQKRISVCIDDDIYDLGVLLENFDGKFVNISVISTDELVGVSD